MRKVASDLEIDVPITLVVGMSGEQEIDLNLDNDEGVIVTRAFGMIGSASAVPSITGAGLSILMLALYGKSQAAPTDLVELEKLLFLAGFSLGSTAAGSANFVIRDDLFENAPLVNSLFVRSQTSNITNAATTTVACKFVYDRYTLTQSERIALLT